MNDIMMTGDTPQVYIMNYDLPVPNKLPLPHQIPHTIYVTGAGGGFAYDLKDYTNGLAVWVKVGRAVPYERSCGNCKHHCVKTICVEKQELRSNWDYCIQWSELNEKSTSD